MQRKNRQSICVLTALCGTTVGLATVAQGADPDAGHVINITGATLLENLVSGFASTNDWLDVDGDGFCGDSDICAVDPDQLAPFGLPPGGDSEQHWFVQYRVVGSVNGFQEVVDWGRPFFATATDDSQIDTGVAALAYHNRDLYISGGTPQGVANTGVPGSAPLGSTTDGTYRGTDDDMDVDGFGWQADMAPVDVPSSWAVQNGVTGDAAFDATPGTSGYGKNPQLSFNKATGAADGLDHLLATLGGLNNPSANRNLFDGNPSGGAAENSDTIFDTSIAFAPVAAWTNHGTGFTQIGISELRYTATTGRLPSGENIIQVTRDSGSGTRNGYMNSLGVDPSWGVGENIGPQSVGGAFRICGPNFLPGNKGGSSEVEGTLQNVRLGFGYSGAERYVNNARFGKMELLAVANDFDFAGAAAKAGEKVTSAVYTRPNIDAVLDNTIDGWRIGGPSVLAHLGDPRSSLTCADGLVAKGHDPLNTNPAMSNRHAAEYLNNISRSLENFVAVPASPDNEFMPGELIATLIVPPTALDYFYDDLLDPTSWQVNPNLNQSLQNEVRAISDLGDDRYYAYGLGDSSTGNPATATPGSRLNGVNPARTTNISTYSDNPGAIAGTAPNGSGTGANYVNQGGTNISYGAVLDDRNRISGDFSGDGARDWNDVTEMMKAYNQRHGDGTAWVAPAGTMATDNNNKAGSFACIEILGDFNCDGSFDEQDVRYWADGLAVDPATRVLSRVEGFTRVDNAFIGGTNFFGTTLANPGATYDAGDSRADVAGSGGHTRQFQPIGQDGMIDGQDIDYVFANFGDWGVLAEAIEMDLSCDMNDDFVVNAFDVCAILDILETSYQDVNLNGTIADDRAIIVANDGMTPAGWSDGDINGDGTVDSTDLQLWDDIDAGSVNPCAVPPLCVGDLDGDNDTDVLDFAVFTASFGKSLGDPDFNADADYDNNNSVNVLDFATWVADFGCN